MVAAQLRRGLLLGIRAAHLFFFSVEDELGADPGDQAVDEAGHLPPGDDFGVDEFTMEVKDEIDDLRGGHALLDVARQGYLVNAALIGSTLKVVLEAELCRLILHAKVGWDDHRARRQTSECLDTSLALHVDRVRAGQVVEGVRGRVGLHAQSVGRLAPLRMRRMRQTIHCK